MEALIPLVIQFISGVVGGGVAGSLIKKAAMELLPKLLAGGIGGIGGATVLGSLLGGDSSSLMDMGSLINNIGGGLVGGGVLSTVAGMVMGSMKK
jgi:hypothetical protein